MSISQIGVKMYLTIPELGVQVMFSGLIFSVELPFSKFANNTEGQCGERLSPPGSARAGPFLRSVPGAGSVWCGKGRLGRVPPTPEDPFSAGAETASGHRACRGFCYPAAPSGCGSAAQGAGVLAVCPTPEARTCPSPRGTARCLGGGCVGSSKAQVSQPGHRVPR